MRRGPPPLLLCLVCGVAAACADPMGGDDSADLGPDTFVRLPGQDRGAPLDPSDARTDDADDPAGDAVVATPIDGGCDVDDDGDGFGATGACGPRDCDDGNAGIYPGAFEACNGVDDDCDDTVDEGLNTSICGVGGCRREVPNCADGQPQRCTPGEPVAEVCNEVDDDCDGTVDEEAAQDTCGVGACARQASCADASCTPGAPSDELCNGVDDNCDGVIDDGFRAGVSVTTYTALEQRHPDCRQFGERIGPNCNAAMNRFCAAQDCFTSGFGPVENSGDTSIVTCVKSTNVRVTFAELSSHHGPCNANPQRIGPDCNAAIHRYCRAQGHTSGFGPIESGGDFMWVACVGDGATVVGTRYSVMTTHHPPCNGNGQRIGPDCNASIHRFCRSQGHASGFGPVENFGDDLTVVCVDP